ncbi:MAG TPA: cytochrome D1 domain-containing protein, partial [bacterium]
MFVTNSGDNTVSVIETATNTVVATVQVATKPEGVAVTPDGSWVYVANNGDGTVTVIDAVSFQLVLTVVVGSAPIGVAVTPDGSRVYVANSGDNTVSVIDTATDSVTTGPVPVGTSPAAFGK